MRTPIKTTLCLAVLLVSQIAMARQPNVVVILTDDQGWGDLSVHGNTNLSTPHLDSLARDGASFDHFYVCQVCAPTRAEFLTGRYYPQTGVSGVSRGQGRLNPDETTIADIFRKAGYATGATTTTSREGTCTWSGMGGGMRRSSSSPRCVWCWRWA